MKNSTVALRLRKGAWAAEEDILLRNCIEKHGEGKWHEVPQKAGLNRCRKSCRLRWLNYLRPNIKRGDFTSDEVDLMIRLHKLLGNRWSLIAGRLPGRTANDVKNYWNSHLHKKVAAAAPAQKLKAKKEDLNKIRGASSCTCTRTLIKPLPRTFSKTTINCFSTPNNIVDQSAGQNDNNNNIWNHVPMTKPPSPPLPPLSPPPLVDDWLKNFLVEIGTHDHQGSVSVSSGGGEIDQEEAALGLRTDESSLATISGLEELGQNGWTDIWNILNAD